MTHMHRVYTDEEEREAAIRYLKNRSAATEEPFTKVVSRPQKRRSRRVFRFIILDPKAGYQIDSCFLLLFLFLFVCFAFLSCYFLGLSFVSRLFYLVSFEKVLV